MNTIEFIFIRNKISCAITSAFDNANYIVKKKEETFVRLT